MCLIDTTDGALMLSLYTAGAKVPSEVAPASRNETRSQVEPLREDEGASTEQGLSSPASKSASPTGVEHAEQQPSSRAAPLPADPLQQESKRPDSLTLLYYNTILTVLTVVVAVVIGVIQILGLVDSVSAPPGKFWDGVRAVQDKYDIVGGVICGTFAIVGIASVLLHKRWRIWVLRGRDEPVWRTP